VIAIMKKKNNSSLVSVKNEIKVFVMVAYIPVLHEGYKSFFDKHPEATKLYLIGPEIIKDFVPLTKDLRALDPVLIKSSLLAWKRFETIEVIDVKDLVSLADSKANVIMPDEDVMRELKDKYLSNTSVVFDSIFLRWDKHKSTEGKSVEADQTVSVKDSDVKMIALLKKEAGKSGDWWRHVAAAIVKDDKVIFQTHNKHVPSEQTPYIDGDPRSDFHKGVNLELSTAFHAEASLVTEAARKGISLEGAEMYATTFPCPPCAKMIAYSGIKKLYYADGYGVLDGERILKSRGVEIIFVKVEDKKADK